MPKMQNAEKSMPNAANPDGLIRVDAGPRPQGDDLHLSNVRFCTFASVRPLVADLSTEGAPYLKDGSTRHFPQSQRPKVYSECLSKFLVRQSS